MLSMSRSHRQHNHPRSCRGSSSRRWIGLSLLLLTATELITTVSCTILVLSSNASYPSLPALYYGKSWNVNEEDDFSTTDSPSYSSFNSSSTTNSSSSPILDEEEEEDSNSYANSTTSNNSETSTTATTIFTATVHLQYYDLDWCDVIGKVLDEDGDHAYPNPVHKPPQSLDASLPEETPMQLQPIALLIRDSHGNRYIQNRPCHLIDYEQLALAWNVSYIIFYDDSEEGASNPLNYETAHLYLDSPIIDTNDEHAKVGFQFVSYETGNELRSMILDNTDSFNTTGVGGIIVQLDGRLPDEHMSRERFSLSFIRIKKATAIAPKTTGLLSMIGSTFIVYSLIGTRLDRKFRLRSTFNRLLLALSICDIMSSFANFLSHWAFPTTPHAGIDPIWHDMTFPYAAGNDSSCTFQGFLLQLGNLGGGLFTGFISIQYVLTVRYNWPESKMRRLEVLFFGIGIFVPLALASTLLLMGAFQPKSFGTCWVGSDPYFCRDSNVGWCKQHKQDWFEKFPLVRLLASQVWILLVLLTIIVSTTLLYLTVRSQERRAARWSSFAHEGRSQKAVVQVAACYLGAYLLIYVPVILAQTFFKSSDTTILTVSAILPMQGIFNVLIYSKMYIYVIYLFPCCCKPPPRRRGRSIPTTRRGSSGPMSRGSSHSSRDLWKAMSQSTMLTKIRGVSSESPQQSREFQLRSNRRSSSGTNDDGSSRVLDDSTPTTTTGGDSSIPPPTAIRSTDNNVVDDVEMNQTSSQEKQPPTKHKRKESFQLKFIDDLDDDDDDDDED